MRIIKNFFITLILFSTLFAGQDLESAKIRLKDKEWNKAEEFLLKALNHPKDCLLYTSPSPRDQRGSRMPSSA